MSNFRRSKFQDFLAKKGLTQTTLAKELNINGAQISLFAKPYHNWNKVMLKKMCVFLKCTPNDIIEYEDWLPPATKKKS